MNGGRLVFIAAVSSDIGQHLAMQYRQMGCRVVGTHRPRTDVSALHRLDEVELLRCDVTDSASIAAAAGSFASLGAPWDLFISAVGDLTPIGGFFDLDRNDWGQSVHLNGVGQLQLLHALYPYGTAERPKQVAFLVGGGINGPFTNYSAYCLGKTLLVKMCELLDDEYDDVHAIAVGTGWVDTKIHRQTIAAGSKAGVNYQRTRAFLDSGEPGTSPREIVDCMEWCFAQGRAATGGRNFSVVHDAWRKGDGLAALLRADRNKYKLRRHGN